MQILTGPGTDPWPLRFSPDGRLIAAGSTAGLVLWEPAAGTAPRWARRDSPAVRNFGFTADSRSVVGAWDGTAVAHDVRTGRAADPPPSFLIAFSPKLYSPDGRFALSVVGAEEAGGPRLRCARWAPGGWEPAWEHGPADAAPLGWHAFISADGGRIVRVSLPAAAPAEVAVFDPAGGARLAGWSAGVPGGVMDGAARPARPP